MDRYGLEDLILHELRRRAKGKMRVDDVDVGLLHYEGVIDIGRLAEEIWDRRQEMMVGHQWIV